MKVKRLIANLCALAVMMTAVVTYAEVGYSSGIATTLTKTETVSCGSFVSAGQFNPVIDVAVDSGNGGVAVKVFKNTTVIWKQYVPEGKNATIDLTVDGDIEDEIKFTMSPEEGKTPAVTYNYAFGDKYNPVKTGTAPDYDTYTVKSQKSLPQYISEAASGSVYALYNYKRIPMSKSGSEWSVNVLASNGTGTLGSGDLNSRDAAKVKLSTTTATLGRFGGTPNIDIPVTEAGILKITGAVPGIVIADENVYKGVFTNIYKNGEKIWSSRVGDDTSVKYDEGYKNSYFNENIDVVTKVDAGDIITFSFNSWHTHYDSSVYSVNISGVNLAYIEGEAMSDSAKWLFKNSDVYDARTQIVFRNGNLLYGTGGPKYLDMVSENSKIYIAADEIGSNISFDKIPLKEETRRETFDYPDSETGLKETYKPFNISTFIGQIKDYSVAYIGGATNQTAMFVMDAEDFAAASNPSADGILTYEFLCKGDAGGDVTVKFGRKDGETAWYANGRDEAKFLLHPDFSCTAPGGEKVTPTYTYSDGWYRVKVEVDLSTGTVYMSVNGKRTSGVSLLSFDRIHLFRIQLRMDMATGENFYVDDAKITYAEDAAENGVWVESISRNGKTYYNLSELIEANGRNAKVVDGRFVVAYEGDAAQVSYSELSQITAAVSDDAVVTQYGTKVDFEKLENRLRVNVKLLNSATVNKAAKVILAGYKDGVLSSAEIKDYSVLAGDDYVEEFYEIDNTREYDTISVFVWGDNMTPEADAGSIEKP